MSIHKRGHGNTTSSLTAHAVSDSGTCGCLCLQIILCSLPWTVADNHVRVGSLERRCTRKERIKEDDGAGKNLEGGMNERTLVKGKLEV